MDPFQNAAELCTAAWNSITDAVLSNSMGALSRSSDFRRWLCFYSDMSSVLVLILLRYVGVTDERNDQDQDAKYAGSYSRYSCLTEEETIQMTRIRM